MTQIIEIDEFEVAFPVASSEREEVMRRFSTLLLDTTVPRSYGSNGIVSKAHNVFGEAFAVKRLRLGSDDTLVPGAAPMLASEGIRAAFRKEYESQLAVSNMRGFPKLFGFGEAESEPLILMEWVEGKSLADVFGIGTSAGLGNALPYEAIFAIGAEVFSILSNLDALSSRLVHRDLSPSNIFIRTHARSLDEQVASRSFDICIIDFGSTTLIDEHDPSFTAATNILRHATPEYAPPEMLTDILPNILELRQSPSIDVYAVCSVLYEALSGNTPFRLTKNPQEDPYQFKMGAAPSVLTLPGYPEVARMIMRGLDNTPASRPSAREMRDVFLRACGKGAQANKPPTFAASPVNANMPEQQIHPMPQSGGGVRDASFRHVTPTIQTVSNPPRRKQKKEMSHGVLLIAACVAALLIIAVALVIRFGVFGSNEPQSSYSEFQTESSPGSNDAPSALQDASSQLLEYIDEQGYWFTKP